MSSNQSIWIIELTINSRSGYTLWCGNCGANDTDLVLASSSRVLIFHSIEQLSSYLEKRNDSNLQSIFERMSVTNNKSVSIASLLQDSDQISFDVDQALDKLCKSDWSRWDHSEMKRLLDCLNFVWDIAMSLSIEEVIAEMKDKTDDKLGSLMDNLTVEPESIEDTPPSIILSLCDAAKRAAAAIDARIQWMN